MKTREEEILEMGMGPRRVMPEENDVVYENAARFVDDSGNPTKPLNLPDKAAMNHAQNRQNREIKRGEEGYRTREFEYDLESDPLWQQYITSAKRNGQNAMTDTMAKVASQTGGIAGSYAVSAGAGAYNDYMQRANDVIPELEQIAYQKYQDDLARDRQIYEMDEAKRFEDAQYNATLSTHQNYGRPLTDEEKMIIHANGGYVTSDGDVVDANGNLIKRGTKYDEEIALAEQTKAEEIALADQAKVDLALTNYMLGNDLGGAELLKLLVLGYNYDKGVLYDPFGNAIEQSYKKPEVKTTGGGTSGTKKGDDITLETAVDAWLQSQYYGTSFSKDYAETLTKNGYHFDSESGDWKKDGKSISNYWDKEETSNPGEEINYPLIKDSIETLKLGGTLTRELLYRLFQNLGLSEDQQVEILLRLSGDGVIDLDKI